MTAPIDYSEIARRVNRRLAEKCPPRKMPEVVTAHRVGRILEGLGSRHALLIREIAAEVAAEGAK